MVYYSKNKQRVSYVKCLPKDVSRNITAETVNTNNHTVDSNNAHSETKSWPIKPHEILSSKTVADVPVVKEDVVIKDLEDVPHSFNTIGEMPGEYHITDPNELHVQHVCKN